ncbi:MAG TPA: outer membrane protein transport protein [Xanthomonadaceae bacterium]|nr:outer membrane protein transport protein [Xanthomonadaceae bacterium]
MHIASRVTQLSALALGIAGVLACGQADASGFQLRENSVKNLGRANTGTTVARDDASVAVNNPAAMVNLDKATFQVDATSINLDADFDGGGFANAGTPLASPLSGGDGGDPGDPALVPAMAMVFPIGDDFRLGASVSAPFGLKTEYDSGWVGRYTALTSDVKIVDLTVSGAWAVNEQFSLGVGVFLQRSEVTLSKAIDFGSALCLGSGNPLNCANPAFPFHPQQQDGTVVVKGSDNDWGWIAGFQWRPVENVTIGYAHHSKVDHTLRGDADFTLPGAAAAALGPLAPGDGAVYAPLTTPATDTLSLEWAVNENVRVLADVQRTGWHTLEQVAIFRDGGTPLGSPEVFDWDDTYYFGIGAEWDISPSFTLRAGIAQDQTPTQDDHRTPRLPDNDRKLYSIGATWHASDALSIDAAFQRITIDTPTVDILAPGASPALPPSSLTGEFSGHANLFGVALQYRF